MDDPSAWLAADYQGREDSFIYTFTPQDIQELDAAISQVEKQGLRVEVCRPPGGWVNTCSPSMLRSTIATWICWSMQPALPQNVGQLLSECAWQGGSHVSSDGQTFRMWLQGNLVHIQERVGSREAFPLPTLGPKLEACREEVRIGRGFQLLRCAGLRFCLMRPYAPYTCCTLLMGI